MQDLKQQPAFIVGVTGHWDLRPEEEESLKDRVRQVFRLLRHGALLPDGKRSECVEALQPQLSRLDLTACAHRDEVENTYDTFLGEWPDLRSTPIIILSSLAPGADMLVAEIALEREFQDLGFHLIAPTPFPVPAFEPMAAQAGSKTYRDSSTFVRDSLSPDDVAELQRQLDGDAKDGKLEGIVRRMPAVNGLPPGFTVLTTDDLKLGKDNWLRQCSADIGDRSRRRRRYAAAGEYIAAYSHLMLAIWDHVDDSSKEAGTAAIVEARMSGLTPGLLPVCAALSLPMGPTLQLFTERRNRSQPVGENPAWKIRWLFPSPERETVPELNGGPPMCSVQLDVLKQGLETLTGRIRLLRYFAESPKVDDEAAAKHLSGFLKYVPNPLHPRSETSIEDELQQANQRIYDRLQRVADFRRRATNLQREQEAPVVEQTISWLFMRTLVAACLLHAFNHWHPQNNEPLIAHQTEQPQAVDPAAAPPPAPSDAPANEEQSESNSTTSDGVVTQNQPPEGRDATTSALPGFAARFVRFALGGSGIAFAAWALYLFYVRRPEQHEEKNHDLRALAEGARVQLIWFMAGIGRSVSANYMQRQRGEFNWIRQAIRSVSFPYEPMAGEFDTLPRELKVGLLRCVFYNWIRGRTNAAQADYFKVKKHEHAHAVHFWHRVGAVFALAGILMGLAQVVAAAFDLGWGGHHLEEFGAWLWRYLGWLFLAIVILAIGVCAWLAVPKDRQSRFKLILDRIDNWLATKEAINFAHFPARFQRQLVLNFVRYASFGLLLAFLALLLAATLSRWQYLPNMANLTTILSAVLFIRGGLWYAWPEKKLYSELAFQYGTMHQLFALAANRIERLLQQLDFQHRLIEDRDFAVAATRQLEPHLARPDLDSKVDEAQRLAGLEFDRVVSQIQEAIFELGQEALDENAEWLILHRARPLEPVMAG